MEKTVKGLIESFCFDLDQRKLELLDNFLLSILFNKEARLLINKDNEKIKNISKFIDKYYNYRDLIYAKLRNSQRLYNKDSLIGKIYPQCDRLILLLTHNCQLRCEYCRVRKFPAIMTEEVLFRAIDLLFTSNCQELQLQFFGGEPLLSYHLLKKGIVYAERLNKQFKRRLIPILTTNGIALSQEKVDFLREHNFILECSIDGHFNRQFKKRKPISGENYYPKLLKNLKYLFKTDMPHYSISVIMPEDVLSIYATFIYLVKMGFKRLQMNYALGLYWPEDSTAIFFKQTEKIVDFLRKNRDIEFINLSVNRREPAVLNSELTVDCDGQMYLETGICLEEDFIEMKNNFFVIDIKQAGNIDLFTPTLFNNYYRLSKVYSSANNKFREIILNNILFGRRYDDLLQSIPAMRGEKCLH